MKKPIKPIDWTSRPLWSPADIARALTASGRPTQPATIRGLIGRLPVEQRPGIVMGQTRVMSAAEAQQLAATLRTRPGRPPTPSRKPTETSCGNRIMNRRDALKLLGMSPLLTLVPESSQKALLAEAPASWDPLEPFTFTERFSIARNANPSELFRQLPKMYERHEEYPAFVYQVSFRKSDDSTLWLVSVHYQLIQPDEPIPSPLRRNPPSPLEETHRGC